MNKHEFRRSSKKQKQRTASASVIPVPETACSKGGSPAVSAFSPPIKNMRCPKAEIVAGKVSYASGPMV